MRKSKIYLASIAIPVLAGCGGGGGDGSVQPVSFDAPPFLPVNVEVSALSANRTLGVSPTTVSMTLGSDGSLTLALPGGDSLTITNGDIDDIVTWPDGTPNIVFYTTEQGDFVDVIVGQDVLGEHTYLLTRVDRFNTTLGFETHAVTGAFTTTLPTGSATYEGIVIGSMFHNGELPTLDYDYIFGDTFIVADFDASNVGVTFDNFRFSDGTGIIGSLSGSNLAIAGSLYDGPIAGTIDANDVDGKLYGGFFGPGAEATAGVFEVQTVDESVEFTGAFDGDIVPVP